MLTTSARSCPIPIRRWSIRKQSTARLVSSTGSTRTLCRCPDQAYADRHFWEGATTFRVPHTVPQTGHGRRLDYAGPDGRKDVVATLGSGVVIETGGVIAFETENALANTEHAWTTGVGEDSSSTWTHTQAETGAGTGLAMHVRPRGLRWDDPATAPAMHFAMKVKQPGPYRVWLLVKFDDNQDDSCTIAVDEVVQPLSEQFSAGELCAYGLRQRWIWVHLSDVALAEGDRTFSIIARKSGLRVDRAYLTLGDELPPTDEKWAPSPSSRRRRRRCSADAKTSTALRRGARTTGLTDVTLTGFSLRSRERAGSPEICTPASPTPRSSRRTAMCPSTGSWMTARSPTPPRC